jgi:hypothetical protein
MNPRTIGRAAASGVGVAMFLSAASAHAFVKVCHQGITTDALDTVIWPSGAQSPALTRDQSLLEGDLTIDVAPRVTGFWQLSMLVGNQFSDGGSYDAKDIVALAEYTALPDAQSAHCLRSPSDDGTTGDTTALASCKAFILGQIDTALGPDEVPDLQTTETIRLHLVFSGDADIPFDRYAFHMGRATHAVQDAFTHMFRSPDLRQVRSVLNWVDWIGNSYDPARDGFQHILALDSCGSSDVGGLARRATATQATTELLSAVGSDDGGRAGRMARASAAIDSWFGIGEICNADNHWCDAPEQSLTSVAGCAVAPGPTDNNKKDVTLMAAMMAMIAAVRRPRHARARSRKISLLRFKVRLGVPVVAFILLGGVAARAEDASRGEVKGGVIGKAGPEEQKVLESHPFGIVVNGGLSIDNAGYDVGVGVRYDLGKVVTVGLSAQYSPWLSIETSRATRGTTDVFAVGIYRFDVRDYLELRFTLSAGVSVLMYDTYAAKQGSVGPYFAVSPLGVAIRTNRWLRLIIDPAELAVAIPQTTGIPLAYREHRFSVAVQANF